MPSPDKRKRHAAILELARQEVGVEDIVDLLIRGGFHKPAKAYDPTDIRAAEKFRASVRRLVYYDLAEIAENLKPEQAAKLPLLMEIYIQQQTEALQVAQKRWKAGTAHPVVVAKSADIIMIASQNIAIARGLDVKGKAKIEIDVGERLAKAARNKLREVWAERRKLQPTIPHKISERPAITVPARELRDDDDPGDFN